MKRTFFDPKVPFTEVFWIRFLFVAILATLIFILAVPIMGKEHTHTLMILLVPAVIITAWFSFGGRVPKILQRYLIRPMDVVALVFGLALFTMITIVVFRSN